MKILKNGTKSTTHKGKTYTVLHENKKAKSTGSSLFQREGQGAEVTPKCGNWKIGLILVAQFSIVTGNGN